MTGAGAALASAGTVGLTPPVILLTCVGLSVEYLILTSVAQKKKSAVRRLEREASALRHVLEDLSGEALSIVGLSFY